MQTDTPLRKRLAHLVEDLIIEGALILNDGEEDDVIDRFLALYPYTAATPQPGEREELIADLRESREVLLEYDLTTGAANVGRAIEAIAILTRELAEARAEVERLRAALKLVMRAWQYEADQGDGIMEEHEHILHAAFAALAPAQEGAPDGELRNSS